MTRTATANYALHRTALRAAGESERSASQRMKIIAVLWLGIGLILGAQSVLQLIYAIDSSSNAVVLSTSLLSVFGGAGLLRDKRWAPFVLVLPAAVFSLYGVAFFLFGGVDDTDPFFAVLVLFLCALSIASVVTFFFKWLDR